MSALLLLDLLLLLLHSAPSADAALLLAASPATAAAAAAAIFLHCHDSRTAWLQNLTPSATAAIAAAAAALSNEQLELLQSVERGVTALDNYGTPVLLLCSVITPCHHSLLSLTRILALLQIQLRKRNITMLLLDWRQLAVRGFYHCVVNKG
jgi:hypothetical protein